MGGQDRHEFFPGKVVERLTLVEYQSVRVNGKTRSWWTANCSCGAQTKAIPSDLRSGRKKSCGCLLREKSAERWRTHGLTKTPEYHVYHNMLKRCYDEKNIGYKTYGGRGIVVCERWRDSFENFYADMGKRPSDSHTIERRNNKGNYEPSNCFWATGLEQANNKSNNRVITHAGITTTLAIWSRMTGIDRTTIATRLNSGRPPEEALRVLQKGERLPRRVY